MLIFLLIISILNTIAIVYLLIKSQRIHRDFAVVERLLAPFIDWINKVQSQKLQMAKITKEKEEAFSKIKKE